MILSRYGIVGAAGVHLGSSSLLIATPDAAPAIGDAYAGGFYTGAAYDTVTTGTATIDIATVSVDDEILLTIPDESTTAALYYPTTVWPFYAGQVLRIAPVNNTTQVFLDAEVVSRTSEGLTVAITGKTGSSGSFGEWAVAAVWRIILSQKSGGESSGAPFKTALTSSPSACFTVTNGRASTSALVSENETAGSSIYPHAAFCKSANDGALSGKYDWEILARDWFELAYRAYKPVAENNYTGARPKIRSYVYDGNIDDPPSNTVKSGHNNNSNQSASEYSGSDPQQTAEAAFQSGGAQAIASNARVWTSSASSTLAFWYQASSGSEAGRQVSQGVTTTGIVRLGRREIN